MRKTIAAILLGALLACSGVITLQDYEKWYTEYLAELDQVAATAPDEASRQEVLAKKKEFEQRYAALPTEEEQRAEDLRWLNYDIRTANDEFGQRFADGLTAAQSAELETYKAQFWGTWQGGGVTLVLENGNCDYTKNDGGMNTHIQAPIQRFTKTEFDVGVFGMNTTFRIDDPPHQIETGDWQMTVDGVLLTRID